MPVPPTTIAVDGLEAFAVGAWILGIGGGSFLVLGTMEGIGEVVHVPHRGVANAVGAECAFLVGATSTSIALVQQEDIPLGYLPGNSLRMPVSVEGEFAGAGNDVLMP